MRFSAFAFTLLFASGNLFAETFPRDTSRPSGLPLFAAGQRVEWADGSRGRVVSAPEWRSSDGHGQWYYGVQFGDADSLWWLLPEDGLHLIDDTVQLK
jgi:hypothetical protein